jgi:Rieske [2Fe-2S] domain/Vanillate O-demethylase oxygenase C-terminal domain
MFLRNCWYAAAWSKDLSDKPLAKTFLGEKVVLFRTASGQPAALADKCCHRAAPLSHGSRATFLEDADILEAVQTNCDGGSLDGLIDITADAAQLQARRMLQRLISDKARGIAAE